MKFCCPFWFVGTALLFLAPTAVKANSPVLVAQSAPVQVERSQRDSSRSSIIVYNDDAVLAEGLTAREVVSIGGSSTTYGTVTDKVISILGNSRTESDVGRMVLSIVGNTYVNGKADTVIAVLGGIELGPHAVVRKAISVGGPIHRSAGSVVTGASQDIGLIRHLPDLIGLHAWLRHGLLLGRPLAIAKDLIWPWAVAGAFLCLYLILAALFPRGVVRCAETLETRPGRTLLAALLCVLLTPFVSIVLSITVIGPLVVFAAVVMATLFGKAALLACLGRLALFRSRGESRAQTLLAVLIGGGVLTGLYLVPVLGLVVWKVTTLMALGITFYTLILSSRRPPRLAAAAIAGGTVEPIPDVGPDLQTIGTVPAMALALPRAGFWIRTAALAIDVVVVGGASSFLAFGPTFFVLLAVYGAMMWKLKGTTIGGIICGLKLVRVDDRPVDWTTAIVRALACFLSLFLAGLGFIWVAFDDEKQAWHDKIAGTAVVEMPGGISLV